MFYSVCFMLQKHTVMILALGSLLQHLGDLFLSLCEPPLDYHPVLENHCIWLHYIHQQSQQHTELVVVCVCSVFRWFVVQYHLETKSSVFEYCSGGHLDRIYTFSISLSNVKWGFRDIYSFFRTL